MFAEVVDGPRTIHSNFTVIGRTHAGKAPQAYMSAFTILELDGLVANAENTENGSKLGTKRRKYAIRACAHCKRRKVRCSGEDTCQQCRSRNVVCRYSPSPPEPSRPSAESGPIGPTLMQPHQDDPILSSRASPAYSARRFNQLCERVAALEHTLSQSLVPCENPAGPSVAAAATATTTTAAVAATDEIDANQFVSVSRAGHDLSLSSQVAAISAMLSRSPTPTPTSGDRETSEDLKLLLHFPDASTLQRLLDAYFRDFDAYFPFLDRENTESRIYSTIRQLGYTTHNNVFIANNDHLSIMALACFILALAECADARDVACDGKAKPGWLPYLQGCRVMELLSHIGKIDLDRVRAQTLAAAYLWHSEALSAASQAVSTTWHLATMIQLNNKNAWPVEGAQEALQWQRLWWTVYFLDRQISRRSGIAYHIRDTEYNVDDFTSSLDAAANTRAQESIFPVMSRRYMQALIDLGRLWGLAWDTFFAIGVTKKGDYWMEVEIMDARILNVRRQLPAAFTWDHDQFANYALKGEEEIHIRRRLQLYTRLLLLRMLIRHNPVHRDAFTPETAHACSRMSREVILAHDLFISRYPEARGPGYFTTSSIVECIYHLAPVIQFSGNCQEQASCLTAFHQAHQILVKISHYNNVAKKALVALNGLLRRWGKVQPIEANGSYRPELRDDVVEDCNVGSTVPVHTFQGFNFQLGPESFGLDFTGIDWAGVPLGSPFGNNVDFWSEIE